MYIPLESSPELRPISSPAGAGAGTVWRRADSTAASICDDEWWDQDRESCHEMLQAMCESFAQEIQGPSTGMLPQDFFEDLQAACTAAGPAPQPYAAPPPPRVELDNQTPPSPAATAAPTSTPTPTLTPTPTPTPEQKSARGPLHDFDIRAIAVAVSFSFFVLVVGGWFVFRIMKLRKMKKLAAARRKLKVCVQGTQADEAAATEAQKQQQQQQQQQADGGGNWDFGGSNGSQQTWVARLAGPPPVYLETLPK